MKKFTILTRTATLGAVALAMATSGQALARGQEFDADGDQYVTMDEFHAGTQSAWTAHDRDGDGNMSKEEFEMRFNNERDDFGQFDTDKNGMLSPDEFNGGMLGRYDADKDGRLDVNETGEWDAEVGVYVEPFDAQTVIEDTDKLNIRSNN